MEERVIGGYLTPQEVANTLKVARQTVYNWITSGKIEARRFGGVLRIPRSAVENPYLPNEFADEALKRKAEEVPEVDFDHSRVAQSVGTMVEAVEDGLRSLGGSDDKSEIAGDPFFRCSSCGHRVPVGGEGNVLYQGGLCARCRDAAIPA